MNWRRTRTKTRNKEQGIRNQTRNKELGTNSKEQGTRIHWNHDGSLNILPIHMCSIVLDIYGINVIYMVLFTQYFQAMLYFFLPRYLGLYTLRSTSILSDPLHVSATCSFNQVLIYYILKMVLNIAYIRVIYISQIYPYSVVRSPTRLYNH